MNAVAAINQGHVGSKTCRYFPFSNVIRKVSW